jgi:hypothetical protein
MKAEHVRRSERITFTRRSAPIFPLPRIATGILFIPSWSSLTAQVSHMSGRVSTQGHSPELQLIEPLKEEMDKALQQSS